MNNLQVYQNCLVMGGHITKLYFEYARTNNFKKSHLQSSENNKFYLINVDFNFGNRM